MSHFPGVACLLRLKGATSVSGGLEACDSSFGSRLQTFIFLLCIQLGIHSLYPTRKILYGWKFCDDFLLQGASRLGSMHIAPPVRRDCAEIGYRGRNDRCVTCDTRTYRLWVTAGPDRDANGG